MAIRVHYHRYPGCGTIHNSACSGYPNGDVCDGPWPSGPHRGLWVCVHASVTVPRRQLFVALRPLLRAARRLARRRPAAGRRRRTRWRAS